MPNNMKSNYASWKVKLLTHSELGKLNYSDKLKYFIHFGHLASSTHNTQPWAFKCLKNKIQVFLNNERVLPASDKVGRQACVSVGCAISSIIQAATIYGYFKKLKYEIHSTSIPQKKLVHLCTIELQSSQSIDHLGDVDTLTPLLTRAVDRSRYDTSRDFPEDFYTQLQTIFESTENVGNRLWHRGDPRIQLVAELQAQADTYVANNAKFAIELAQWMLPNDTNLFLGMPGSTFHLSDEQTKEVIEGLKNTKKMKADLLSNFASAGKKGLESAAFICMLTVTQQSLKSWIEVGMLMAKIQYLVELFGGSMAMHAGLAEVSLVRMSLAAMGMTTSYPVILFRAGIRDPLRPTIPHSPRLPLSQVLL